ncbi:MAG: HDOD domain-containing protein [Desulfuromonadaceae bacterium]|nr:HDOD domain-containing protein [Desulfuromonadaceae bacterium]MDD2849754.1 HDOD domain-containing protein [Desulfuromonadaceae bacterium]MDD4130746.1 HDOD domain-containing protein [Desulfuromonadaceae bacterium]
MTLSDYQATTIDRIVEETSTVYSLPLFYERLNETINHPRSSIDDISRIITEDQGLTARLLRLANSPMFGCYAKVDSITKAVTIIGTQQLRDLALAASVMGVFKGIPEELLNMTSFWRHCIACGIIARSLAVYMRESNVERLFVAGMLHDVGQVVLAAARPEVVRELLEEHRDTGRLYLDLERERLGFDHAELGGALLKKWKIPSSIGEPVAFHHRPSSAEQFRLETALVHFSDIICQAMEFGQGAEWGVPPLDEPAWDRLGLSPHVLGSVLKQSESQIAETFAILSGGEDD